MERPNPLQRAAQSSSKFAAAIHGLLGAAVSLGLLSAAQAEAIDAAGMALPGWIMAVGVVAGAAFPVLAGVQAAFTTAKTGRDDVTPVADPRDSYGERLTPEGR